MEFKLDEGQVKKLRKWQKSIKKKYGSYGGYSYKFSPNGIGIGIEVYSELAKKFLELSEVDKW
jgi:hypothetical protein